MVQYRLDNVTAMYPKLDKTYRFDQIEGRSVPCAPTEDGAEYSINFMMNEEQAKQLHAQCVAVWKDFRATEKKAPEKPTYLPYKKTEEGGIMGKAKIKGAYNGEPTRIPLQVDAENKKLDEDFQLTSGSKINLVVRLTAYATGMAAGVTARIVGVQVVELMEAQTSSPFDVVQGGYTKTTAQEKQAAFEAQKPASFEDDPFAANTSADDWVEKGGDSIPF